MARGSVGYVPHPVLSPAQLKTIKDKISKVISKVISGDVVFQNAKLALCNVITHYIQKNSKPFLSWMHNESLSVADELKNNITNSASLSEIITMIQAIKSKGALDLYCLLEEKIVWGLVTKKDVSELARVCDWPTFQAQIFSKTLEIVHEQQQLSSLKQTDATPVVGIVVEKSPIQQLQNDITASIQKLLDPGFDFLGKEKRDQKLNVLRAALTFIKTEEKNASAFVEVLAKNPNYSFAFTPGKTSETLRLVREMVSLYPAIKLELESRRETIREKKVQITSVGLFRAPTNTAENKSLRALELLTVPNQPLPAVVGTVVAAPEKKVSGMVVGF